MSESTANIHTTGAANYRESVLSLLDWPFSLSFEFSAMEIAHHSVIKITLSSFLLMCHHHNVLTSFSNIHTSEHYPIRRQKKVLYFLFSTISDDRTVIALR